MRMLLGILVVFSFIGCATTQQPSALSNLQIKVAQLENKLEERDQQISALQDEVRDLSSQVDSYESNSTDESIDKKAEAVAIVPVANSGEIIRVEASAEKIQTALKKAGYYDGAIDGKMGAKSQKAISDFQADHNLTSDGIVGRKTWLELKKYLD